MATNFLIRVTQKGAKGAKKALGALTKTMGGLARAGKTAALGAAAVGGAAVIAGGKAVKMAGEFDKVNQSFINLNKSAGFSSKALDKYKKALDGTVSSTEIMKMSNNAMLLGIAETDDKMAEMFDTAQRLAAAVGEDAAFGVNSLVTGMGRQSKLMLDNLGIMIDVEKANKDYAETLGKSAKDLTDSERKIAFNNAAMAEADRLVAKLGDEQLTTADKMAKMKAGMIDTATTIGQKLSPAFSDALDIVSEFGTKVGGVLMSAFDMDFGATGKNIATNMDKLGNALIDSLKAIFDSDTMIKVLSGIKDGFLWVMQQAWSIIKNVASFLFEPILVGGKIIAIKTVNYFIEKFNDLKEVINTLVDKLPESIKKKLGMTDFKPTLPFSLEGLDMAQTQMAQFLSEMTDDQTNSNQEVVDKLAQIWSDYGDGIVVINEKIEESEKKKTGAIKESGKVTKTVTTETTKVTLESGIAAGQSADSALGAVRSVIKAKFSEMMAGLLAKEIGSKGLVGVATAAVAAFAANQLFNSLVPSFAQGGDFVTSGPQMIMVGDNPGGAERVQVTPLDSGDPTGGGGSVNISFAGNVMSQDFIEDEAIPMIKEAIRRGADLGIA